MPTFTVMKDHCTQGSTGALRLTAISYQAPTAQTEMLVKSLCRCFSSFIYICIQKINKKTLPALSFNTFETINLKAAVSKAAVCLK